MNIDPAAVERAKSRRAPAPSLPVHFAGRSCDMDALMAIAERARICTVIEDCAHAIETEYHGRKAGTFGDFGCFSFYVDQEHRHGRGRHGARADDAADAAPHQGAWRCTA